MKMIKEDITPLDVETLRVDYVHLNELVDVRNQELEVIATKKINEEIALNDAAIEKTKVEAELAVVRERIKTEDAEFQNQKGAFELEQKGFEQDKKDFAESLAVLKREFESLEKQLAEFQLKKNIYTTAEQNLVAAVAQLALETRLLAERENALRINEEKLSANQTMFEQEKVNFQALRDAESKQVLANRDEAQRIKDDREKLNADVGTLALEKTQLALDKGALALREEAVIGKERFLDAEAEQLKIENSNQAARQRSLDIKEGELIQWEREIKARVINT